MQKFTKRSGKDHTMKTQTQEITMNGATVKVSSAQLARAKGNSEVMQARIKTGRGAESHTYADLASACKADYEALVQSDKDALERKFNLGRNLLTLRSLHASDKAFGLTISTYGLDVVSKQDRNDLMWLAKNVQLVRDTIKDSTADLSSLGMSALRKRSKAHADKTGKPVASVTDRDTSSKKKAPAKPEAEVTVGPSDSKLTANDIASDALELAIANGIDPQALLKALANAIAEATEDA